MAPSAKLQGVRVQKSVIEMFSSGTWLVCLALDLKTIAKSLLYGPEFSVILPD